MILERGLFVNRTGARAGFFIISDDDFSGSLLVSYDRRSYPCIGTTLLGIFPPYSAEVYPTEIRGTGAGWSAGFTRIGSFIGPLFGGVLLDLGVSAQVELVIFGAPLLIGSLVMLLYGVQTHMQSLEQISPSFVEAASGVETVSGERIGD